MSSFASIARLGVLVAATAVGCGDDGGEPVFPEDYLATYTEVRDCRANGGSHDFNRIRVLADATGLAAYTDRVAPFPIGSVVVKEEYDPNDTTCSGDIMQWSVMQRLADGNEDLLNWRWQRVGLGHTVISEDEPRCFGCHADCVPPDGYFNTCTVP